MDALFALSVAVGAVAYGVMILAGVIGTGCLILAAVAIVPELLGWGVKR